MVVGVICSDWYLQSTFIIIKNTANAIDFDVIVTSDIVI